LPRRPNFSAGTSQLSSGFFAVANAPIPSAALRWLTVRMGRAAALPYRILFAKRRMAISQFASELTKFSRLSRISLASGVVLAFRSRATNHHTIMKTILATLLLTCSMAATGFVRAQDETNKIPPKSSHSSRA
jgi:hypothetical protein